MRAWSELPFDAVAHLGTDEQEQQQRERVWSLDNNDDASALAKALAGLPPHAHRARHHAQA